MTDTALRILVEEKVRNDFDEFDFAGNPMQKFCEYYKAKHISMATQIVMNAIEYGDYVSAIEINDMVHGLNHIFFNGVAAGQAFERFKKEGE